MKRVARDRGVATVTMDYRGLKFLPGNNGVPESRGFPLMTGAKDTLTATKLFESRCKSIRTVVLMGVSLGGNTSGLALAMAGANRARSRDGSPLYDYWIDVEGEVNLIETYLEARAAAAAVETAANAKQDIEEETGGPIERHPGAYETRTVVARMDDIEDARLRGAVVIHGLDDGLVPYNQGREMAALLDNANVSTDMITIGRKSEQSERETTASGYAAGQLDPDYRSPLAGHASERSTTHIVMVTAFDQLTRILHGEVPQGYDEIFVDGG